MFHRGFRGSRRRNGPRAVVQSYKKVINIAPASLTTARIEDVISNGKDSVAAGQTSPTDADVPTGALIKFIEIQFSQANLVAVAMFTNWSIMQLHSEQTAVGPNVVGGSARRNQVFRQGLYMLGQNQNNNRTIRFKVPPKFQRVREGDSWRFVHISDQVSSASTQIIYKFYR